MIAKRVGPILQIILVICFERQQDIPMEPLAGALKHRLICDLSDEIVREFEDMLRKQPCFDQKFRTVETVQMFPQR